LAALGDTCFRAGDLVRARQLTDEAIALSDQVGEYWIAAWAPATLGWLDLSEGDILGAISHAEKSLARARDLEDPFVTSNAIVLAAGIAFANGDDRRAARLIGAADAARERAGAKTYLHHFQHAQLARSLEAALGEQANRELAKEGGRLSEEEALADVWSLLAPPTHSPTPASSRSMASYALTERELDVLRFLPAGKTDQEIADALFISRRTVTTHIGNILAKLGVTNRTEAAAKAVDERII
jgi:non-specific serine/threonine protein kinase